MRSKLAFRNIVTSLLMQTVSLVCGFIIPKLIIDHYGSDVNGLVVSITQFLAYIALLEAGIGPVMKSRLYGPIARKDHRTIENILFASDKFFKRIAGVFILYVLGLCIVYPQIVSSEFDVFFTATLLVVIAVSTFAEYFFGMTYKLYMQAEQKTYLTSLFQTMTTILNTVGVVVLVLLGYNIIIVKALSSVFFVLRPLLQTWYIKKKYDINFKHVDKNYQLPQKWDGLSQHIAAVIRNNTDVVVLTLFSSIAEVSVYSVYLLVITGLRRLVESLTSGIDASFGDMLAKDENESLKRGFGVYEFFFLTMITVIFGCALVLIVPFVEIYTTGVTDADYIRPVFAVMIVLSEFACSLRMPYHSITIAAGRFRETMKGAWVEAILNVAISVGLVFSLGIVGVAIGTVVAMTVRTVELAYYSSRHILKRSFGECLKKMIVAVIEVAVIFYLFHSVSTFDFSGYGGWAVAAAVTFVSSTLFVLLINLIYYKDDVQNFGSVLRRVIRKKGEK